MNRYRLLHYYSRVALTVMLTLFASRVVVIKKKVVSTEVSTVNEFDKVPEKKDGKT